MQVQTYQEKFFCNQNNTTPRIDARAINMLSVNSLGIVCSVFLFKIINNLRRWKVIFYECNCIIYVIKVLFTFIFKDNFYCQEASSSSQIATSSSYEDKDLSR